MTLILSDNKGEPNLNDSIKKTLEEEQINEIWARYGTLEKFEEVFSSEATIISIIKNKEKAFTTTKAPTLYLVEKAYGDHFLIHWLSLKIEEINASTGVSKKMEISHVRELAKTIYLKYPILKTTEIILFVFKMKSGEYGEFFGVVDPLKIMTSLTSEFMHERRQIITNHQLEKEKLKKIEERKRWKEDYVTREEYEIMKKKGIRFNK